MCSRTAHVNGWSHYSHSRPHAEGAKLHDIRITNSRRLSPGSSTKMKMMAILLASSHRRECVWRECSCMCSVTPSLECRALLMYADLFDAKCDNPLSTYLPDQQHMKICMQYECRFTDDGSCLAVGIYYIRSLLGWSSTDQSDCKLYHS